MKDKAKEYAWQRSIARRRAKLSANVRSNSPPHWFSGNKSQSSPQDSTETNERSGRCAYWMERVSTMNWYAQVSRGGTGLIHTIGVSRN